ncbi:hypothetical protein M0R45_030581 [Rubus argutus]|uniref:Uncharacterized protein n=1 Tax=Rubus argutus TaxID=59490 RepID=A0AAW1WB41_RUBAR
MAVICSNISLSRLLTTLVLLTILAAEKRVCIRIPDRITETTKLGIYPTTSPPLKSSSFCSGVVYDHRVIASGNYWRFSGLVHDYRQVFGQGRSFLRHGTEESRLASKFELKRRPFILQLIGNLPEEELERSNLAAKLNSYAAELCPPNIQKKIDLKINDIIKKGWPVLRDL